MTYKIERSPPEYEHPPPWKPAEERWKDPRYNSSLTQFLPRTIVLQKQIAGQALGFNIRGGKANECGVYISKVMPESDAENQGLKPGDQVLTVNGENFTDIDHTEAVDILKRSNTLTMRLQFFPFGYEMQQRISGFT